MSNLIKCPHCSQSFEPTEAFKHELEETVLKEAQAKHREEIEKVRKDAEEAGAKELKERAEEQQKMVEDLKEKQRKLDEEHKIELEETIKSVNEKARVEAMEKSGKELKDKEEQILALRKRAEQAEEQELQIRKEKRSLEEAKRKFELDKQRQLDEERDNIRVEAKKEAEESMSLNLAQEKKKNDDAQKQILELQRKLQQGSQQAQGEVMELELEALLRREFPSDKITEVKKGQRGADVVQEVVDKRGRNCGVILWESKNAKWSQTWVGILKENQRQAKAQLAVLVATDTPAEVESFVYRDGIWIATRKMALPLALALRFDMVRVTHEKAINVNKSEKAEVLYQYITSTEFKHRVEAIVETYSDMQNAIEQEKRWFTAKWAKQEKQIRRVVDNTIGMRADLEGLVGNVLPAVDFLELPEGEENM